MKGHNSKVGSGQPVRHELTRRVRFSVNPFSLPAGEGGGSLTSQPTVEGLTIFFEMAVTVVGAVEKATGFVINVTEIEESFRKYAVPIFSEKLRGWFREGRHTGIEQISEVLRACQAVLTDKIGGSKLSRLCLSLNPSKNVAIDCEEGNMIYYSEKFDFAATHKLWNDSFSEQKNFERFGKCANPSGHGHNYVIEVTVKSGPGDLLVADYEKNIDEELLKIVDHKNLNVDVPYFSKVIPTVENIAVFAWEKLNGKFKGAKLHCITVWETDKTYCAYYGN